ncbi:hypothetical protein Droror1_Dr00021314 [Drosera rotundifolia]
MEAITHLGFPQFLSKQPSHHPTRRRLLPRSAAAATSPNGSATTPLFSGSKWADRLFSDFQFSSTTTTPTTTTLSSVPPSLALPDRSIGIPLNFYQVLGAEPHFLGDGIRRAFEARASRPPQYGYSQNTLVSRGRSCRLHAKLCPILQQGGSIIWDLRRRKRRPFLLMFRLIRQRILFLVSRM